jgi:hypothetical protein
MKICDQLLTVMDFDLRQSIHVFRSPAQTRLPLLWPAGAGVVSLAAFFVVLAALWPVPARAGLPDWQVDPTPYKAKVERRADGREIELNNGLVRRVIRLQPGAATVRLDNLVSGQALLRSVRAEAVVKLNGQEYRLGGLTGQPVHNFLKAEWLDTMKADTQAWHCVSVAEGKTVARFDWRPRQEWLSTKPAWPPAGVSLAFKYEPPAGCAASNVTIQVHYELYDGLPMMAKWLTIQNGSTVPVTVNAFIAERLAVVEPESIVDGSAANFQSAYRGLDVFSDYAFGGNMNLRADGPAVAWNVDPWYTSQIHYPRQTPCLLECAPPVGPEAVLAPGATFESFRVFELLQDTTERERRGLALRKAYRALAPWGQECPILMHVRDSKPEAVRLAVDQCAELGFEMVIMTFGSGADLENPQPENLEQIKELADYARGKGIVLGGYSLLASRSINADNDAINPKTGKPGNARFGNSPCLESRWGREYFDKLYRFFETTGCGVLEHDGSYPGDLCASTQHPGHRGLADSQWAQWQEITTFYQWCRARGIYLNVPDWYFLSGSSKCGMGYREENWSLPRDQQEIIERQNIFDGTWEKTPSMGWMFVPLVEYQGGGAAATIEPLREHLEHYETRLANLFGGGVMACYRGPRLYDAPETRAVVKRWVDFYRGHRAILDSDLLHLRRPDGNDWDGWMHVNAQLPERALAVFYNPLGQPIQRRIQLPMHYTGLTQKAGASIEGRTRRKLTINRGETAEITVDIPARGRTWVVITPP